MTTATERRDAAFAGEVSGSAVFVAWLASVLRLVLHSGRRGVIFSLLGAGTGVAVGLALPDQYTSASSFIAQAASPSALPSVAQEPSVGIGTAKDYSPQFYADLVTSDPVLTAAISRVYTVSTSAGPVRRSYVQIEGFAGKSPPRALDAALHNLRRRVVARADVRTNIITVSCTARYPELSRDLTQSLLDALDSINIRFRQKQSREFREFFGSQVADAQRELDSAEATLRHFLERNRVTESSPLLTFEQMRLTRAVDLKRAVYTTVVQRYEEAKIREALNVPVLTVLAPPATPIRKSGPPRRFIVVLGLLLGFGCVYVPGVLRSIRAQMQSEPPATERTTG